MTTDVQDEDRRPEPAALLLSESRRLAPSWLRREGLAAATRGGVTIDSDDPELDAVVDASVARLLDDLEVLLGTDVDEQRTNPLSLFRSAVGPMTELLTARGVRPPVADGFAAEHFPDDVYRLGPAAWSDVHPDLHEPGITWGAWKAMTVLRRRRHEGRR